MRDIKLKEQLISLIHSRDKVVSSGKLYTADPEHAVISRSRLFEEYVAECNKNSISPHIDSTTLSKWAAEDLIDLNSMPESERDLALSSIKHTSAALQNLGLAGYEVRPGVNSSMSELALGDEGEVVEPGFSAYGPSILENASFLEESGGFIGGPDSLVENADATNGSSAIGNEHSAYQSFAPNSGNGLPGKGFNGGAGGALNEDPSDLFSRVAGVVSSKAGKNGSNLYSIDGKPAFIEYPDKIVPSAGTAEDENVLLAAVLLASKKFGGTITINGDEKFVTRVMEVMAKNDIDLKFSNPAQANFFLGVASSVVRKAPEPESPLDSVSKKGSFTDRMTDIAAYSASVATGGVVSADKMRAVAELVESGCDALAGQKKKTPGPTFH